MTPKHDTTITNPQSHQNSKPNWHKIAPGLPPNITPMDNDGLLETHQHFLLIETKRPGVPIDWTTGSAITLKQIAKQPNWDVLILWTNPPNGPNTHYQSLKHNTTPQPIGNYDPITAWWNLHNPKNRKR